MISLENQIQIIAISILYGIFFMFIWSIFNRLFFKHKKSVVRLAAEIVFMGCGAVIYFYLILVINGGVMTVYMPVFLLIGVCLYQFMYAPLFLKEIEKTAVKIDTKLIGPIKAKLKKISIKPKKKKAAKFEGLDWTGFDSKEDKKK